MTPWPRPWRVEIRETGRCGWLTYHEAGGSISLYWELGGGDTVVLIWGEEADHWNVHQAWAAGRRLDILERIPAGRWGEAADLAGAAVFLASGASDYVNGQILAVDGGWLGR